MLGIAAVALSGCAALFDPAASSESTRQKAAFPKVYAQTITWEPCDQNYDLYKGFASILQSLGTPTDTFRCAMIDAPFDWNDAGNEETISLAAAYLPTSNPKPLGTLLTNPGGPGESGLQFTYATAMAPGFDKIMANYNVLGFDPRGVGRSTPIDCEGDSEHLAVDLATCVADNPLTESMGTSQVARDMDLLRHLMSDDKLNYLGYSYGTVLGGTYSTIFPEKVGRMVLDSASGAEWTSLRAHYDQTRAIALAITDMVTQCGTAFEVEACPGLDEEQLAVAFNALKTAPLTATDGTAIDRDAMFSFLASALYQPDEIRAESLTTVTHALVGQQSAIDLIAEDMNAGGSTIGMSGTVVRCHSFPADPDVAGLLAHIEYVGIPPLLGDPTDPKAVATEFADLSCFALPSSGDDITLSFSGSPENDILVVGITGDHATPYQDAQALVGELGTATLLTLEGNGHTAAYSGRSACIDNAVTAYLLKGTLPPEGKICTDD